MDFLLPWLLNPFLLMKCHQLLAAALILIATRGAAQLKLPVNSSFRNDVQKVVEDYPQQFASLRGEIIEQNPQTIEYASLVKPAGAMETSIVRYSSNTKAIYSWQAIMLSTEEFEEAAKKYKWLFQQLKGMNVKYVADLYTLKGSFEEADESRGFSISTLTLAAPPTPLKMLKVEVAMEYEFPEWKVKLLVYEKEREDDEQGTVYDQ